MSESVAEMYQALAQMDPRVRSVGYLHTSLNHVTLADTENTVLLTAPDGHTLILFALWIYNLSASVNLQLGTGATLTQRVPRLGPFLTNFHEIVAVPPSEFETTIYATASAAGTGIQIKAYAAAIP